MSTRRWSLLTTGALLAAGSLAIAPTAATVAAPPHTKGHQDPRLGNGLNRLLHQGQAKLKQGAASAQSDLTIRDAQGRIMVDLTPQAGVDRAAFRKRAEALGLVVKATDPDRGTLEGFVPLDVVQQLASIQGVGTIAQALRPFTRVGAATTQGVALQRIDKVQKAGVDGKGITVGVLSDSYDVAGYDLYGNKLKIHAKQDIKSGDLPGKGNKQYPQPVVVLQDGADPESDTDEGRAMLQIVHDIAPAAKLCFASADYGQVDFADSIRRLAAKSGPCRADVIVDDIGYFDEPFFSDGVVGDAVDDVTKQGVQYMSAAGNAGEAQAWDAPVRLLPAKQGVKGTNIDLSDVDPALYDGGLEDMDPGSGTDVAQDLVVGPDGGLVDVQWNDPFDLDGAKLGKPYLTASGQLSTPTDVKSYKLHVTSGMVGQLTRFLVDGVPSGSTDVVLTVIDPNGNTIAEVDNTTSPESYATKLAKAGDYTVAISGYDGSTGPFTLDVSPVTSLSKTTTDFNLLFFDEDGSYLGAADDLNPVTGRPQEQLFLDGPGRVQMVIARRGTGPLPVTQLRNIMYSDIYLGEYVDPLAPAIYGHPLAAGATAVGAYDPFKPFLPEFFTSPGGKMRIDFDSAGNRYSSAKTRLKPEVSGTDDGNTTFFVNDDTRDGDTLPNFAGTSAAAPHVAGIAALVLQKSGGPGSVTPSSMRSRLQSSTYTHDLDPMHAEGSAGGVTLSADGEQGYEKDPVPGPMNDPNFFKLRYTGSGRVTSLTLYADTASPTSLAGMVFDKRPFTGKAPFRDQGFPFTVGSTSGGLTKGSVSASFAGPDAGDSTTGQYKRMTLSFANGLKQGQGLSFGVDRDLAVSGFGGANEGNGADELGGATFLPSGTVASKGMKFTATLSNGSTVTGYVRNALGKGFSPLDGYGLVNAEKAVLGR